MRTNHFMRSMVMVASFALCAGLPALATQAADQPAGGATPTANEGELDILAAGAVQDTLKACLARIPKDASSGQRMMAEQGCEQEDAARKVSQAAPRF
jgi:hypothetical protein